MQLRKIQYILVLTYNLLNLQLTTYNFNLDFPTMGRYRPPQAKGSCYITRQGYDRLIEELDFLWHKRRPEVTRALTALPPRVIDRKMLNIFTVKKNFEKLTAEQVT